MNDGWIAMHRKILDWEWYHDINVCRLFFHIILKANHMPKKWKGKQINRGQFITGLNVLESETGLSVMQIRTALNKLKATREITIKVTNKYSLLTVVNYDEYQFDNDSDNTQSNTQPNRPVTGQQHTSNTQVTTTNNDNNQIMQKCESVLTQTRTRENGNSVGAFLIWYLDRYEAVTTFKYQRTYPKKAKYPEYQELLDRLGVDEIKIRAERYLKDGLGAAAGYGIEHFFGFQDKYSDMSIEASKKQARNKTNNTPRKSSIDPKSNMLAAQSDDQPWPEPEEVIWDE